MRRRDALKTLSVGALAGLPLLRAGSAGAQQFPQRAVTLYCAFPAGGPTDQVFRAMGEVASRQLKHPVVVENRPGAGGTLAPGLLRTARPDGHTVSQLPMGIFRIPYMQKNPTLDPLRDITYVINLTGYTFGLVVPADAPWKTLQDFVAYAKGNPDKITYGSTGTGTSPHLAVEEFASHAGIKLTHVPFKGSADLMTAILGKHIMAASDSTGWAPHVESGRLRLLATYGSKRTKRWPDVPTLEELGYKTVSDSPFGIGGPRNMDPAAVKALHDAFRLSLEDPKVLELLERFDQPVIYMGPEEYARWAKETYEAEAKTIERLGLKGTM
ncbi:MAG TPA: tripartite tricarboxylate transporter substrate binding protein [Burkholderiaceae bacterium]|jgi:tripartite-type tricarboxylate transporter receptor subunit TctC|nr:tripartite tricarboxylate transporter substrate binding protein [Burkholderiaceae bacterium]